MTGKIVFTLIIVALCSVAGIIYLLIWQNAFLFANTTLAEFIRNLILAFISIALGIPTGLAINRCWQSIQDKQRKILLLEQLKKVFETNLGYLDELLRVMSKGLVDVPSFPLDLVTLEATSEFRYELISNSELLIKIDKAYYELVHVNGRLQFLQQGLVQKYEKRKLSPLVVNKICYKLKEYHEFIPLCKILCDEDLSRTPEIALDLNEENVFWNKINTIELAVGLTKLSEKFEGEIHNKGGAYSHCKIAIEAIDEELNNLGYTNTES